MITVDYRAPQLSLTAAAGRMRDAGVITVGYRAPQLSLTAAAGRMRDAGVITVGHRASQLTGCGHFAITIEGCVACHR